MSIVEKFVQQMESGTLDGGSEYSLRNEMAQQKVQFKRINKISRDLKKLSKVISPMELALPFNPATGQADEEYNESRKYRPIMSATTLALALKTLAGKNEALYEALLLRSGQKEWDVSDPNTFTPQDWKIFRPYRVPRKFTLHVIGIKDSRITGQDYTREYTISVKRDKLGQIEGEVPLILQANRFYSQIRHKEVTDLKEAHEMAKNGKSYEEYKHLLNENREMYKSVNLATIKEDDFKELRSKIYQDTPVTDDYPVNYLIGYEFELDGEMNFRDASRIPDYTVDDLDKHLRLIKVSQEIDDTLEKFVSGSLKGTDRNFDYQEFDMECPSEVKGTPQQKDMLIAKGTRYNNPVKRLDSMPFFDKFYELYRQHQDASSELESRFMISSYVRTYSDEIERQVMDVIALNNELENKFLTQDIMKYNAEFLTKVYGQAADMLLTEAEIGLSDLSEDKIDINEAQNVSKQENIAAILNADSPTEEEEEETSPDETGKVEQESQATSMGTGAPSLSIDTASLDD